MLQSKSKEMAVGGASTFPSMRCWRLADSGTRSILEAASAEGSIHVEVAGEEWEGDNCYRPLDQLAYSSSRPGDKGRDMSNADLSRRVSAAKKQAKTRAQADQRTNELVDAFRDPLARLSADRKSWEKNFGPMTADEYCKHLSEAYLGFATVLKRFDLQARLDEVQRPSNSEQPDAVDSWNEQLRLLRLALQEKGDKIADALKQICQLRAIERSGFAWQFFQWMETDGLAARIAFPERFPTPEMPK